jgi:hypothetical protein
MTRSRLLVAGILLTFCSCGPVEAELDGELDQSAADLSGCVDLSGVYAVPASGSCSTINLPGEKAEPSDVRKVIAPNKIAITQTSCSRATLKYDAVDYAAYCKAYNAKRVRNPYDACAQKLFDCGVRPTACPTAAELAPFKVAASWTVSVGASTNGNSSRAVTIGQAAQGATIKDVRKPLCGGGTCLPAVSTTFNLKKSGTGLQVTRTGYIPQTCVLSATP